MNYTLIVSDGNCGDEPDQYKKWLEENLPENVTLEWRDRTTGVGDGLFDDENNEIEKNDNNYVDYWIEFCN